MKKKLILVIILALAFFLRFYRLTAAPPSLNWDEVSHGYNAYSVLKTGRDEWGVRWPLIFRAYGDYKLPVYIYLTAASIGVFGLNEFAVRFPSALAGVLSVLFTYLLTKKLFSGRTSSCLSFLASLFLAVSPWHLFLSRPAFEANLASFLIIAGVYFFLEGLEKRWFLPLSLFLFGLSVHTYNSARVFTPLILLVLVLLYRSRLWQWVKERKRELFVALGLLFLFFIPWVISFLSPAGQARFRWVTILDQGAINRINESRRLSALPPSWSRLVYNKATFFLVQFSRNYLANFSPVYLFFRGGSNYQYNLPGRGIIYPLQLPFVFWGLFWLIKNRSAQEARLLLFWWLLAVVPAAATRDNPHVLRTILVLPVPQILASLGIWQFWEWWCRRVKSSARVIFPLVYGLVLLLFVVSFEKNYFGPYRKNYSWAWQYGYREVAHYLQSYDRDYDQIFMTKKYGEPHEFLLFYLQWDPERYRSDPNLVRYFRTDWYWVDSFAKFIFVNDWEIAALRSPKLGMKSLLITSPGNYPQEGEKGEKGWERIKTIEFLDGQPAFEILRTSIAQD